MAAEPWYPVAKNDVFPEQLGIFLLGNPSVKKYFMRHHAELLTPEFWQARKKRIMEGLIDDVFPYPQELRFSYHSSHTASAA